MAHSAEVLGLIPARGGSKTIPRKNILPLAGYPLIAYSIAAGLKANRINRLILSTDDQEIADIGEAYGAEVPFLRPEEHAQDQTPDLPVFQHALIWLSEHEGYTPDMVVQLRPTSPFRKVSHIDRAIKTLLDRPEADSVRSVCQPFQDPFKMWRIDDEGFMVPLLDTAFDEPYNMPRQQLPEVYWQTGYVDAAWSKTILEKKSMTGDKILPLIIGPGEYVDIDSRADWKRAELMIQSGEIRIEELGFQLKEIPRS